MKLRLIWLWSWFCFRVVLLWPGDLLRWPFGAMLPWAGPYANVKDFAEFRSWWPGPRFASSDQPPETKP